MSIAQRLTEIKAALPPHVRLVAVSKFHPVEALREAYDAGHRCFGESRVQELQIKYEQMPRDVEWHFIGHLQTNKVKYIVPFVSLIHSIDSSRILDEVEKQAGRIGRVVDCLLEVHVAQEDTKYGFSPQACIDFLSSDAPSKYAHVRFRGIMGMASFTDDDRQVQREFEQLKNLFDTLRLGVMSEHAAFDTLSMGMSHDYLMAINHGSTMVRIGTTIFGARE